MHTLRCLFAVQSFFYCCVYDLYISVVFNVCLSHGDKLSPSAWLQECWTHVWWWQPTADVKSPPAAGARQVLVGSCQQWPAMCCMVALSRLTSDRWVTCEWRQAHVTAGETKTTMSACHSHLTRTHFLNCGRTTCHSPCHLHRMIHMCVNKDEARQPQITHTHRVATILPHQGYMTLYNNFTTLWIQNDCDSWNHAVWQAGTISYNTSDNKYYMQKG